MRPETIDAVVRSISDEAEGIRLIDLIPVSGQCFPIAEAGAHIDLFLYEACVRQYSLCNGPDDREFYRIAVKLEDRSRGGSAFVHRELKQGAALKISAPRNHFAASGSAQGHLLVAGGIGITPLFAMSQRFARERRSFRLEYFTRGPQFTAFRRELRSSELDRDVHLHYNYAVDQVRQYVTDLLVVRPANWHVYVCGPKELINLVKCTAAQYWPADAIHIEYFSTPVAEDSTDIGVSGAHAFDVELKKTGGVYRVPSDRTIVQSLREQGVDVIPTSCEEGVCGTCETKILSGIADHRDFVLSAAARAAGNAIMPCISRCRGTRLVLDV